MLLPCWPTWELPEVYQRAIRLSIAVLFACAIGYGLILPDEKIGQEHRKELSQGLKWSAITCIVVNAPVIGRVAQTGTERIVGTVVGGMLGFGVFAAGTFVWTPFTDGIVLSVAAAIVAFTSVTIGAAYGLENSTKLYALTFMLVTFGSDNLASRKGSLVLALTRIFGIAFGVLLSEISCCLIFPKSATGAALSSLRQALKNLTELNAMVWQHGPLSRPEWRGLLPEPGAAWLAEACLPRWSTHLDEEVWAKDAAERERLFEAECERALMESLGLLGKVQDLLPQARSEIFVGHVGGGLCFLPGISWVQIGRRVLPEGDIQELATCVRRVSRLLWGVHLSFQQGFDANMLAMLRQQYPARLLPELAGQVQACLQEAADAFPNGERLPQRSLAALVAATESLLRISDYQRRRVLHALKRGRASRQPQEQEQEQVQHQQPASAAGAPSQPQQIARPRSAAAAAARGRHLLGSPPPPISRHAAIGSPAERAASGQLPGRDYALGRSKSRRDASGQSPAPTLEEALLPTAGEADGSLTAPLLQNQHSPPAKPAPAPARQQERPARVSTSSGAYAGSPSEVFQALPEGLSIEVGSPSTGDPVHSYSVAPGPPQQEPAVVERLQRVPSGELIVFPETAEGFVDKVRWFSFLFLMEELTEEVEIMHDTIGSLLQKLPRPCLPV